MTGYKGRANEMLANAIWAEIRNPARIFTKSQVHQALFRNGIRRSMPTLFGNTDVRRLLEDKAEAKGMALVIERGCIFITTQEWQILHKKVTLLRYLMTLAQSVGHEGTGNDILMSSADPVSRNMGRQAIAAGVFGAALRRELNEANEVLATTFKEGRQAANEHFAKCRARADASI
jgi:hypothetical protein